VHVNVDVHTNVHILVTGLITAYGHWSESRTVRAVKVGGAEAFDESSAEP
jgi:hypothetical protein